MEKGKSISPMAALIKIPKPLQSKTGGQTVLEVEGRTVQQCIEGLLRRYPDLRGEILDHEAKPVLRWMFYVNDESLPSSRALSHSVRSGDVIALFPVVNGG